MSLVILLLVSLLPVVLLGLYVYNKDRDKEPAKLLAKLFFGGIASCFMVLFISEIMGSIFPVFNAEPEELNTIGLIINVFIGIALVEEFCKWLITYSISYNSKEFDELYDMMIYSAFVALGFAGFENILYVFTGGISVGILRALLSVPGHVCDGIFMGYFIGLAKISETNNREDLKKKNLILSILVPSVMHGIFDYCIMSGSTTLILTFFAFVIAVDVLVIKKIKKVSSLTGKNKYKNKFCPHCGHKVESNFCPVCGNKNE